MNRRNSLILYAALGVTALALGIAALWGRLPHPAGARLGEPAPLSAAQRAEEKRLNAELHRRDARIAVLERELRELNRRLAERGAPERESAREAVALESNPPVASPRGDGTISAGTAQWLRQHLPEEYQNLTPEELTMLTELNGLGEEFTDSDLRQLAALTHLRRLSLRGTQITDAGLAYLGDGLEFLDLRGTQVTGAGFQHLPTWKLEALHLSHTQVKANELFLLPAMPHLKTLKLNSIALDESSIEAIGAYPSVRHLEVDSTGLTDAGLQRILHLNPHLTRIELRSNSVTKEGLAAVSATYPDCELVADSGHPFAAFR